MNYAVEIGSGVVIYVQSFIKTGLIHSKLTRGNIYTDTQRARLFHKPTFTFQGK
jgi:hypothetical protein